jgi:hypothetical protein
LHCFYRAQIFRARNELLKAVWATSKHLNGRNSGSF